MPSRRMHPEEPPIDVLGPKDEAHDRAPLPLGDLAQALRIGRVGRADHDHCVDHRRHPLHRALAVRGRVADILLVRTDDAGEPGLERVHHLARIVDGQGRLRHIGQIAVVGRRERRNVAERLHERDGAFRQLPHRAHHFRVPGMADEHDVPPTLVDAPPPRGGPW